MEMGRLNVESSLPRIAMISTHGYVANIPPLGAADTGGQVVYVLELSKQLAELGYEVDIWTRRFEQQPDLDMVNDRVRVIRVPCAGQEFVPKEYLYEHIPEWSDGALRTIKRYGLRYDFIASHYWDAGLAGQRLRDALDVPHLHIPHSLGLWKRRQMELDFPDGMQRFAQVYNFTERIRHERLLYEACDLVAATTPQQRDLLRKDYGVPSCKCCMLSPGYDDSRFFPADRMIRHEARRRLGFSGKVVLAIGRLARNKGYDLLINGFCVLARRLPEATLRLAVGGADLSHAERSLLQDLKQQTIQLELQSRVVFDGFVPDTLMADYYRAADLFVLSSRYEPFGMTAAEAMASGVPTVVTVHGGLHRALTFGKHALYADPFDKEDLGITMLQALKHPRLSRRLARMGAQKVRDSYTWSRVAQRLMAVLARHERSAPVLRRPQWDDRARRTGTSSRAVRPGTL